MGSGTGRVGAYWPLGSDLTGYLPAGKTAPPSAVPVDSTKVFTAVGADGVSTALRFSGEDDSCVQMKQFTATEDTCLFDPITCTMADSAAVTGFSLSFWVNLPNSFDKRKQYIMDTGGDESGNKGIAIWFINSPDGNQFNQEVSFLVSTGSQVWMSTIYGLLSPSVWNNIGIRWSASLASDLAPYGLQIFVNDLPVAWKRVAQSTGFTVTPTTSLDGLTLSVGCKASDATSAMSGYIDNLAIWYWRLRHDPSIGALQQPSDAELGEIEFFMGDIGYGVEPCTDLTCMNDTMHHYPVPAGQPWAYYAPGSQEAIAQKAPSSEDTTQATDGDCTPSNTASWAGLRHPMCCADTVNEIASAIKFSNSYTGYDFIEAAVRTVNKGGPEGLLDSDISRLLNYFYINGAPFLLNQTALTAAETSQYMDVVFIMSKLSEELYQSRWHTIHDQGGMGLTNWASGLDLWLTAVAARIGASKGIIREANNTVALVARVTQSAITGPFIFPVYGDPMVKFTTERKDTWGECVTDSIMLPQNAFVGWAANTPINLNAKLNNIYDQSLPNKLSSNIIGTGDAQFFVNSRVISLSADPPMASKAYFSQYPLEYTVQLKQAQDDRPYRKGAVLCVSWEYSPVDAIGSWTTSDCQQKDVNDTHVTCTCTHMTDFAALTEDYTPTGYIADAGYIACLVFYIFSLICLLLFIIVYLKSDQLWYEIHTVHFNLAIAMFMALVFYMSTWSAYKNRLPCTIVSIFLHYFYTSAYIWFCLAAHYVFRAITSGKVTGIMMKYALIGWGVPALIVAVMAGLKVEAYGVGVRCLASFYNFYIHCYIGSFLLFCVLILPLLCITMCNLNKNGIRTSPDWGDLKHGLIGICIIWPLILLTWLMALFVYVVPQDNQAFDFMFDFFNSLQGILIFVFLGVFIPSFRQAFLCHTPKQEPLLDEKGEVIDISKMNRVYYN